VHDGITEELIAAMDSAHARACAAQRELLSLIARLDPEEPWERHGARDLAHWLAMRYGVSQWKALRWISCARALEDLPAISEALASGELGMDKAVELTRFARPGTERDLIKWARGVSARAIRERGDLLARKDLEEAADVERSRRLDWWYYDGGRRFGISRFIDALVLGRRQ